jgi:NodT family efflux transporter outer membrane factor (OMF) lipoprotein
MRFTHRCTQKICVAGALAAATLAILTGCKVGPNFKAPQEPVPDQYSGAATSAPQASADAPPESSFWWQQFHDPQLDALEDKAAAGNLDLKAAYLRIVESRVQVQSARAQGLPSLNASASYNREELGLAGIVKSQHIDTSSPAAGGLISQLEKPVNLYQLGFDASWELDLFGKVRRSVEAADAQALNAVESRNGVLISLQAEVAEAYFQLRAGQVLRQITADQIAAQRDVVDLTQSRQQHGLAGEADVATAQAQLANLQSTLPPYEQSVATSKHALAVLTGQNPEAMDAEFADSGVLPAVPGVIPVGLPSTLARRRPDIRASEAALHAATAQIGVAVAEFFPDVTLSGTLGLRNLSPGYLFQWDSKFYTFGPTVSIPLFHGGALDANVKLSRAQAAEAALSYRKSVLTALQEVEDGLTSLHQDALRTAALQDSVNANQRALDVDLNSYNHGLTTYISVLTVQLQTVQARQQLAQAQLAQNTDLVKLYKALGGGWEGAAEADSAALEKSALR